jgi:hypothetical protein
MHIISEFKMTKFALSCLYYYIDYTNEDYEWTFLSP